MRTKKFLLQTGVLAGFLYLSFMIISAPAAGYNRTVDRVRELASLVAALHLGLQGYTLGAVLTDRQKIIAADNSVDQAYQGTYKFRDGDLFVVVDKATDTILAMYERQEDADYGRLKAMVAHLMTTFSEPTTMAHGKIIYWAFTKNGLLSEDDFNRAKKAKQTAALGVLATVKFNSTMEIVNDDQDNMKDESGTKKEKKGTVYFILTSDQMVNAYMAHHPVE